MNEKNITEARISSLLKERREELNIDQQELADRCQVRRETINRIEAGKFLPNMDLFFKMIKELKIELIVKKLKNGTSKKSIR